MRVSLYTVAQWIMSRTKEDPSLGTSTRDIQQHFHLDTREASRALISIKNMRRYECRWEPGEGWPASKSYVPGKLYIDAINKPQYRHDGWGKVTATRIVPRGDGRDVLHYNSVYDAELRGWFSNGSIYACLRGELKSHKGYTWKAQYPREENHAEA